MFHKGFGLVTLRSVCFAVMTASGATAASANVLVPHRAVYDLELKDASDRSGIAGMYGRMVYEFNGSACEGIRSASDSSPRSTPVRRCASPTSRRPPTKT